MIEHLKECKLFGMVLNELVLLVPKNPGPVPSKIKQSESLNIFDAKVKKSLLEGCQCRFFFKVYLSQEGFV